MRIAKLDATSGQSKLSARVGIDSGAVVVGAGAGKEADVFGDAPNIAARVQAVAEPGTVMITEATQRLVSGLFVVEERGARVAQGNRTAGEALPRGPVQRRARATRGGGGGPRDDAVRRARGRIAPADESLGAGARGRGSGRHDYRRGGNRQVAPGAALPRGDCVGFAYLARMRHRAVLSEHALLRGRGDFAQSLHWDQRFTALEARWRQRGRVRRARDHSAGEPL